MSVGLSTLHTDGSIPVRSTYVLCETLATGGGMTIPVAVIAKLEPTAANVVGSLSVETRNDTSIMIGNRTILIRASNVSRALFETVN